MITILLRCVIIYALLVLAMRLTGKRQIGELEISELITTLLLSELAAIPVTNSDIPLLYAIIPIFVLSAIEVIITYFTSRNPALRSLLSGKPSAVIRNGEIDQGELKKLRMGAAELMAQLRIKGVSDPSTVKYAFFEEDGQMSVFTESDNDFVFTIISDGHINRFNLREAKWSIGELSDYLKKQSHKIDDVFLATSDPDKNLQVIYKDE